MPNRRSPRQFTGVVIFRRVLKESFIRTEIARNERSIHFASSRSFYSYRRDLSGARMPQTRRSRETRRIGDNTSYRASCSSCEGSFSLPPTFSFLLRSLGSDRAGNERGYGLRPKAREEDGERRKRGWEAKKRAGEGDSGRWWTGGETRTEAGGRNGRKRAVCNFAPA